MSGADVDALLERVLDVLAHAAFGDDEVRVDLADVEEGSRGWALGAAVNLLLDELAARRERAERAAAQVAATQARQDVLAHLSHDMMTPLSLIVGGLETLEHLDQAAQRRLRDKIARAAGRLERDVRLLLDNARTSAGIEGLVELEVVDVHDVVRSVAADRAGDADVALALGQEPVHALADGDRVDDVVTVLLGNAITHGEAAEHGVELRVTADRDLVHVDVVDHGPGVPAASRELVFERFGRGETATSGAGVGLHAGRQLAEAMGGSLTLLPTAGPGAAFRLTLRRARGRLAADRDD